MISDVRMARWLPLPVPVYCSSSRWLMDDAVVLRRLQEICCGTSCKLIPLERPSAMPSACVQSRVCGGSLSDERGQGRGSRVCRGHRKVRLIFRSTQQYHCPVGGWNFFTKGGGVWIHWEMPSIKIQHISNEMNTYCCELNILRIVQWNEYLLLWA